MKYKRELSANRYIIIPIARAFSQSVYAHACTIISVFVLFVLPLWFRWWWGFFWWCLINLERIIDFYYFSHFIKTHRQSEWVFIFLLHLTKFIHVCKFKTITRRISKKYSQHTKIEKNIFSDILKERDSFLISRLCRPLLINCFFSC